MSSGEFLLYQTLDGKARIHLRMRRTIGKALVVARKTVPDLACGQRGSLEAKR